MKHVYPVIVALQFTLIFSGCRQGVPEGVRYAATLHPLAMVLQEIAGDRATVDCLVPPGVSPHTYEPRPSDARNAAASLSLFFIADSLDGWAAKIPASQVIAVAPMLPDEFRRPWTPHEHEGQDAHEIHTQADTELADMNPHFWGDPRAVRALLPGLADRLAELDPEGAVTYRKNAVLFGARLEALDSELTETLAPIAGKSVAQFHPSWDYFFARYGIIVAGTVEPYPGKEATPQYLEALTKRLGEADVRAVCTEPQLPRRPAEVVAEACSAASPGHPVRLCEIDPIGGVSGRMTYEELLRYNAHQLIEALR